MARAGETVERWGIFELALDGPDEGNPFLDVRLGATFSKGARKVKVGGFYDGEGVYRLRFSPDEPGRWRYVTTSNRRELDGRKGELTCTPAGEGNHGPVRVWKKTHFAYADGRPYFQVGTTCYSWVHQSQALQEQTLGTLKDAPFNKLRMCVFPKHYTYCKTEPPHLPFPRTAKGRNDLTRFVPAFFRHIERRVADLRDLGIEADLILFHPYDRWGYQSLPAEVDDRYLRYTVARLAAFRNVWWSMANEYDLMKHKTMADWHRFFEVVAESDPYDRLRGIHNCRQFYDHTRPLVTHASIQSSNFRVARELPRRYGKPCIYDECRYEGNIPQGWGNISAEEMVHRFWLGTMAGCYVGHGETYKHPEDILWWSKGGVLHGQSPPRIAFLKQIMADGHFAEMTASPLPGGAHLLARPGACYVVYCEHRREIALHLPGTRPYRVDGFDTWKMTRTRHGSAEPGAFRFTPPAERYLLRLTATAPGAEVRPAMKVSARPAEGTAPLTVAFSARGVPAGERTWDFGDGEHSHAVSPTHTYALPGRYAATLVVSGKDANVASLPAMVRVDRPAGSAIVRAACGADSYPPLTLHGKLRMDEGELVLPAGPPWGWAAVGDGPLEEMESLRSLTVLGWAKASSLKIGSGGNRIACNLNYDRAGIDLVHLADGRLRLAVNQWPDKVDNDSSPGKLAVGKWVFFAVTYDAGRKADHCAWYFGDADTPARLDRRTTHAAGATSPGSGPLTIGNYNAPLHRHGTDRQFRGRLKGVRIFGSAAGDKGALGLDAIRREQRAVKP